jgi:hypothetical protein
MLLIPVLRRDVGGFVAVVAGGVVYQHAHRTDPGLHFSHSRAQRDYVRQVAGEE